MAATGTPVDDRAEGDWRITHLKTETPVRFAGFNLGDFQSVVREHNGYRIELYANRQFESALATKSRSSGLSPADDPFPRRHATATESAGNAALPSPRDPAGRLDELTENVGHAGFYDRRIRSQPDPQSWRLRPFPVASARAFRAWFTFPPWLTSIRASSLHPRERSEQTFFSELLETHEVAHQWWGNMVVPASYHDDWLIESLANYSALLLLERRKGVKAMDDGAGRLSRHLLARPRRAARSNPLDPSSGVSVWSPP